MSHKVALITGSTSGIGLATACALAEKHCAILLHGLAEEQEIDRIKEDIHRKHDVPVHFVGGDLRNIEEVDALCKAVREIYPDGVDILVSSAGYCPIAPLDAMPTQDWMDLMNCMVTAQFVLIKNFLPNMKTKGWGRIIINNSFSGQKGMALLGAYTTAKHAQLGMMKCAALEAAGTGVTVNAVCASGTTTALLTGNADILAAAKSISREEALDFMKATTPLKVFNTPEMVAELISFVCFSACSDNMTGGCVPLDGGALA